MNVIRPFSGKGLFYKGNLHCHSTLSDGKMTPQELVEAYRERGYSFLALSEHNLFTDHTELCSPDFLTLPAIEWEADQTETRDGVFLWQKTHHVHGIRLEGAACSSPMRNGEKLQPAPYDGPQTAERMCRYLKSRGLFCIYNHPLWSKTSRSDYADLDGFTAMEIYNFSEDLANATGDASLRWDELLDDGKQILGVAADDNHNGGWPDDSFGGYIQVWAPELSRQAITRSIVEGRFYSSSGMELQDVWLEERTLHVRCAPASRIDFIAGPCVCGGETILARPDATLTEASYTCGPDTIYVRVVCTDARGTRAWSNPFYLSERRISE